ncbi:MAG: FmdB family zinc ribbon protein [Candidatus Limnocylindrales bacterium]
MPVYDYACTVCGRTIEVMHGVHDSGPLVCEACGGPMRKVLSAPAIVFKGSGWAKKDARAASHARSARKSPAGAETGAPGKASGDETRPTGTAEAPAVKGGAAEGGASGPGGPGAD